MTDKTTEQPAATESNISISDLIVMFQVLQAAAARGAIKAEEMSVTGALHDKLKKFLEANGAVQAPAVAPTEKTE